MDLDKRIAEGKAQRKVSHSNEYAKNVLTRNAGERLHLEKVTKHLDKEKTAKEAQLNHAQRLLLRRYGMQKDSDVLESGSDTSAKKNSFAGIKHRSPIHVDRREHSGRLRSSTWGSTCTGTAADSFDNVDERFSAVSISTRECERSDIESIGRGVLYSKANFSPKLSSKRTKWAKTRPEVNLKSCESPKEENDKSISFGFGSPDRSVTGKNISELLPPFVLPPIYTAVHAHSTSQHKHTHKRSKKIEHPRLCVSLSDPGRQKSQICSSRNYRKEDVGSDLSECRYLRSQVNKGSAKSERQ